MGQTFEQWCEENNPKLLNEWHPSKNFSKPSDFKPKSTRKVWWLGSCGHEWESAIFLRVRSDKCPVCEGRLIIRGINDLSTTHPELAEQWDTDKNGISVYELGQHSNKKYWWICDKGHEWEAPVSRRVRGSGCPYCSNHKVLQGFNDLSTTHPELARQWHPTKNGDLKPTEVNPGSLTVVWWLGSCGHEWDAPIEFRTKFNYGCPYCSNSRLLKGFNDLATTNPGLAKQWHPTKNDNEPSSYFAGSPKKVWWICPYGHEWEASIVSRRAGSGCPTCFQGSTTSFQEKALAFYVSKYYEIEENYSPDGFDKKEIDIFIPSLSIGIEYDGERYHRNTDKDLEKNHLCSANGITLYRVREEGLPDVEGSINYYIKPKGNKPLEEAITFLLSDIAARENRIIDVDPDISRDEIAIMEMQYTAVLEHSLRHTNPELVNELHPTKNGLLRAEMLPAMSNRSVWWQCEKGHEWKATIVNRTRGNGCPICSNRVVLTGYNDLVTTNPDIAKEWHPSKNGELKPTDVTAGAKQYVWWQCEKGHEWKSRVSTRLAGSNCPFCANQTVQTGTNDLATLYPSLAAQWHPTKNGAMKPTDLVPGSHTEIWWQCEKGHEWKVAPYHRVRSNTSCPYCSGKAILDGFNDLLTLRPDIAKEWHPSKNKGLEPTDVGIGNGRKIWWLCKNGHEWEARVSDRCGGNGCPICSGRKVLRNFNDLYTTNPELAAQWHPSKNGNLTPHDVSHGMEKKVWWLGPCGHEWEAKISDRSKSNTGCPICQGRKILIGFNDLASQRPDISQEWHPSKNGDLKPTDVTVKSNKKVWWLGPCGHEWEARVYVRTNGGKCPFCSNRGAMV